MTTMIELAPTRRAEDPDEITIVDDVEEYTVRTHPGCNDDNPYR